VGYALLSGTTKVPCGSGLARDGGGSVDIYVD